MPAAQPASEPEAAAASPKTEAQTVPIAYASGDGIGPEIMQAVLFLMEQAGAALDLHEVRIGRDVYERGISAGIEPDAWDTIRRTGVFLKAPITTPQGKGYKSLNVTIRKTLGLYANLRPCPTYHPFIRTAHPGMDVHIVRENEEDVYGAIEHQQTPEVTQCLKLITRPGTEKIVRFAFEHARQQGRGRVTCFTKDNIMKQTDGLFHRVFDEIAPEYPDIEADHMIIDIGTAKLAKDPTRFDVIVLPNLYGDIVSDVAAELAGSVGLAGSANIGDGCAMFEAVHGSAPDIAGRGVANPSGLLHAAILMLDHIGQPAAAQRLENAWRRTIEDGILTADLGSAEQGVEPASTEQFTQGVADRLGLEPRQLAPAERHNDAPTEKPEADRHTRAAHAPKPRPVKALLGVDVFLDWDEPGRDPEALGKTLTELAGPDLRLRMITNRGTKVYPQGHSETLCTDHWRCRFVHADDASPITHGQIIGLLNRLQDAGFDFIKTEHLYSFDGERGFSLGQGE